MIIQAGFDFVLLAHPLIVQDGKLAPRLVLITLDAEMQLDSVEVIADDFAGCLVPFHDAVLTALDREYARFFAIAHPGRFSVGCGCPDPVLDEARALEKKAAERGLQLIGHIAIDESGYMSARASMYFDQYPRHNDLPRTMLHWSHSELDRCVCARLADAEVHPACGAAGA